VKQVLFALLLAGTLAAASPTAAPAYEFFGPRWPAEWMPVPYCVNPTDTPLGSDGQPILTPEHFAYLVQQALQQWEDIPESSISFAYLGLCPNSPVRYDFVNSIGWGWLSGAVIGLADAGSPGSEFIVGASYDTIYEMDIVIDIRYAESFDDMADYINRVLPRILLHETGHFIGLGHSTDECAIMYSRETDTQGLCWDDIAGAAALYPAY
jgi:hypothetical protein